MKSVYVLLLLAGSIPSVLSVYRKYYLISEGRTWADAQAYCRTTYADLAIIDSKENMDRFQNDPQIQQLTSSAWIGMYNDINSWRWSFGNEPLGSMRNWRNGQPDNSNGNQVCVTIQTTGWSDRNCISKYSFVCLDERRTGTDRYINVPNIVTWYDAQSYCRTYHTDLVSTKDAAEYLVIISLINLESWIGLFRDSWKWLDKTKFSTISWTPNLPNNLLKNEDCGYINNYMASDALCSDVMPFICYLGYPRKTMLRVKVRSDQDMKDSAVQLVILELIKQKLKYYGITENITVKWRKQSDGLVFHKENSNNTM